MKSHGYVRFHTWAQDRLLCTGPRGIAKRRRFAFGCTVIVELPKRAIFRDTIVSVLPSRLPRAPDRTRAGQPDRRGSRCWCYCLRGHRR